MADGYIRTRPDTAWWMEQIRRGVEFRKKAAYEGEWEKWRSYIRGNWRGDMLPVNKSFSILRQLVPRVYFRNPAVSVLPAQGGFLNMAFAQLLGRLDNKLLLQMNMKKAVKKQIQDAFMFGSGMGKLGYGGLYSPTINADDAPVTNSGETFEYSSDVMPGMPWYKRIPPGSFIVPDGCDDLDDSRWAAHWIQRPVADVKGDPRFKNTQDIRGVFRQGGTIGLPHEKEAPIEMVDLVEIRDRKFRRVMVIAPYKDSGQVIYDSEDEMSLRRFPFFELIFNPDDEWFWGTPDMKILEPQQKELNEVRTQQMKHRRVALAKFIYRKGAIAPEQISNLYSEDVMAGVEITGDMTDFMINQNTQIPTDYIPFEGQIEHSIRESMGFSRNQMGEFQTRRGDTSATEAAAVNQGSEIRVDERRDLVADMVTGVVEETNEIIFDNWNVEQVVEVAGPGGAPVWVQVDPRMLRSGRYYIRVDPDSAQTRTRQQREAKSAAIYNLLKTNPFIDPLKLTQYLITEIEGVEFDDLMRAMPPVQNGQAGGVLNPGQYASLLQQGSQQLASNPGALAGLAG